MQVFTDRQEHRYMTGQTENTTFAEPSHAVAIKQGDADNY